MIKTAYSFHVGFGKIPDVISRIQEIGWKHAPIADRNSTFGFSEWNKAATAAGLKPVFGVELPVVPMTGEIKPVASPWVFLATKSLEPLHRLIDIASSCGPDREFEVLYEIAEFSPGIIKVAGPATLIDRIKEPTAPDMFMGLSPSTPIGLYREAKRRGFRFLAASDNVYPREKDQDLYRIALGRRASVQTYPQHILSDDEYIKACWRFSNTDLVEAIKNRNMVFDQCEAKLGRATLFRPQKPKKLREMCEEGASKKGVDLNDPVYASRLDRELTLIYDKKFEDYFYVISDVIAWAKQRMAVGPGRGSSAGSLVCYLLDITEVDPIKFGLIFERFIDISRSDLPDIDIDFSDVHRDEVFEYVEQKYGKSHVARLGTVLMFRPKSVLNAVGTALRIPKWRCEKFSEMVFTRAPGDDRADKQLADSLTGTDFGRELLKDFPALLEAAEALENHPTSSGRHAAGVCLTQEPVNQFVAIDRRTGTTMADMKVAEELGMLKIDMLGLTQLSAFDRCLELIGKPRSFLQTIPLDDPAAFKVINDQHFSGIFQYNGGALQSLTRQVVVRNVDDVIALTALARPGPLDSGQAYDWVERHEGKEPVDYPHSLFENILGPTFGVIVYQEQIMRIGREIGDLDWPDVIGMRKVVGKKLGAEAFNKFKPRWKENAIGKGIGSDVLDNVWSDMATAGAYSFNLCLSGDVKIRFARASENRPREMSLSGFYKYHVSNPNKNMKGNWSQGWRPTLISLFPDGRGRPQKITNIVYSGMKHCYRYIFDDGDDVVCTKEHGFFINNEWKPIGKASIGSFFTSMKYEEQDNTNGRGHGHIKGTNYFGNGFQDGENNPGWINGFTKKREEFIQIHEGNVCEDCGVLFNRMEAHHNDFNKGYDRPDDLAWLCVGCHKKRHYKHGRTKIWQKGYETYTKKLVKIEYVGMKETFDIEMPVHHNFMLANGLVTHNSHATAYGIMSYWCAYLKAYWPVEFAAATLDYEHLPANQIGILRELEAEGIKYVPVDPNRSIDRWSIIDDGSSRSLLGPLTNIKGIGAEGVKKIIAARTSGGELPPAIKKKLAESLTPIDSLYPVQAAINVLVPDWPSGFPGKARLISELEEHKNGVLVAGLVTNVVFRDFNSDADVRRRGYSLKKPSFAINLQIKDDTGSILSQLKIPAWNWDKEQFDFHPDLPRLTWKGLHDKLVAGKTVVAVYGSVAPTFRMLNIKDFAYLGETK